MKNIHKDTKYIIKRILIGVGIAVVLFNLKKCNVYALSTENFYYPNNGVVPIHGTYSTTSAGFYYEFNTTQYSVGELAVNFRLRNLSTFRPNSFVIFKNKNNNNVFILPVDGSPTDYNIALDSSNYYCHDNSQDNTCSNTTYNELIQLVPQNGFANTSGGATTFTNSATGTTFYYGFNSPFSASLNFNTDYEVVDTNITNLTINNVAWEEYFSPDPLSSYTEIDITGKEAILIVPKSYLAVSNTDYYYNEETSEHFIDLKYGFERCIRSTLVDITDVSEFFTVDSWLQGFTEDPYDTAELCGSEPTLTYSRFLYNSPEMEAMGHPYNYMALLLYNNSIDYSSIGSNWVNNQHNPYGANSVWVNTELYNYYLIDNLKNFNQTITYKDSNGDDQSTYIESLPTFDEMIDSSLTEWDDNTNNFNSSKIEAFISFVKLPFTFLKSLTTDSCSPIVLPFPHSNYTFRFPCIKATITEILGSQVVNIIQIIINGLIIYRFTIGNIWSLQESLDPVEDKLEVLQL